MHLLIVDDERPARDRLRRMLALAPGIGSVREAADGVEALRMVESERPDALLLDIEMPELSGIDLAASLPAPAPLVVFVTAHEDYALRAFDSEAVDYLLKPFDQARLQRALERLRARLAAPMQAPPAPPSPPRQLLVSERGATRVVQVADIEWLETADNYVALHTSAGAPLLRQTLGALLGQLGPAFVRCHRRAAVRLSAVARIEPLDKGDCELVLRSGARVPCSRQYRPALLERLDPVRPM
ncbi:MULTISPECIES: LytR/AlgR family response regulator transcription factor [Massilia]|uniref:Response regulator n=1 Tax=Massilia aurea TaxID=373040 RepID=A0A422QR69_9BURK|nr:MULTISPECIES: LytTR family DNA-binding domain-containing protein [Massilia]MDY0963846.1 LytTR family DNA-binding domain-containing protein [Massilia sp. CFBP9026]RNF32436.1 response regulator [Massilia aurea]